VASTRAAWPLAALLLGTLAVAQITYSAWVARDAPGPVALAVALGVAFAAAAGLALFGGSVPYLARLQPYQLPRAVAVLLGCLMIIDLLGLLAARAQTNADETTTGETGRGVDTVVPVDPTRLMVDVDRELLRRCTDGVPNRRYLRLTPQEAAAAGDTLVALEETQPTLPPAHRDALPALPLVQRAWLLAMAAMALVFTAAAGVLWVVMAQALLANAASSWANAATALALLIAGGYAARAGHLVWSRIDVESTLYEIAIGTNARAGTPDAGDEPGSRLRVRAFRALSAFYAAGEHLLGSRSLRALQADDRVAVEFVKQVEEMSARSATAVPGRSRSGAEPIVDPRPSAQRPKLPPRYCSTCGTALLQGAQFCQQCGQPVVSEGPTSKR
jgi:zinc-ribbon domain